ncbi:MAG: tetratricopeptide repeat protein [Alphaproteobacteria bacterium]|nr:tetratricopeptide repeat protein [Alphaproteobacteria bacterium]
MDEAYYLERARSALALRDFDGARCLLRAGLELWPAAADLKLSLARLCVHKENLDEAIQWLDEVAREDSRCRKEAVLGLAVLACRKQDLPAQERAFRSLYFLNPNAPELVDWLFPEALRQQFDAELAPLLSNTIGMYLFDRDEVYLPHKRLLRDFGAFSTLSVCEYHRNFLEIGTGCGATSFIARRLGFDVIATDIGVTDLVYAGQATAGGKSRDVLGIAARSFLLSPLNSVRDLMTFDNGRHADVIYMKGVQFNRTHSSWNGHTFPSSSDENWFATSRWFGLEEWQAVLADLVRCTSPGGLIVMFFLFGVDEALQEGIERFLRGDERCAAVTTYRHSHPLFGGLVDITIRLDSQCRRRAGPLVQGEA